jgi:hypothetical protein
MAFTETTQLISFIFKGKVLYNLSNYLCYSQV